MHVLPCFLYAYGPFPPPHIATIVGFDHISMTFDHFKFANVGCTNDQYYS